MKPYSIVSIVGWCKSVCYAVPYKVIMAVSVQHYEVFHGFMFTSYCNDKKISISPFFPFKVNFKKKGGL